MPIKIPEALPARSILESEHIFVMEEGRASAQDIRPLNIAIFNIMPEKVKAETQLLRLLGNSPLQVNVTFFHPETHESKNTTRDHLDRFYETFSTIKHLKFDGLIITGAPVEQLAFEDVTYWNELCEILEWSKQNVTSTLHICWGAQAGLYYHYNIEKYPLEAKCSGVYYHNLLEKKIPLVRGFDDTFYAPHSRYTDVVMQQIKACPDLRVVAESPGAGAYLVMSAEGKNIFLTGHPEYDRTTLKEEYDRDIAKGLDIHVPVDYFPNDNPANAPLHNWRSHAHLLFTNWLNYYVYQVTPYNWE